MKPLFLLLVILMPAICFCRGDKELTYAHKIVYQKNLRRVYSNEPIIWYGVDMSRTRLIEWKRIGQQDRFYYYDRPRIISFFEEHEGHDKISRHLHRDVIFKENDIRQSLIESGRKMECISMAPNYFNIDSIQASVKGYKLKDSVGLGMTLIVSNFIKEDRLSQCYYVFFDVKTREVLFAIETNAIAGGKTLRKYWGESLYKSWHNLIGFYWMKRDRKEAILNDKL